MRFDKTNKSCSWIACIGFIGDRSHFNPSKSHRIDDIGQLYIFIKTCCYSYWIFENKSPKRLLERGIFIAKKEAGHLSCYPKRTQKITNATEYGMHRLWSKQKKYWFHQYTIYTTNVFSHTSREGE